MYDYDNPTTIDFISGYAFLSLPRVLQVYGSGDIKLDRRINISPYIAEEVKSCLVMCRIFCNS